ncbi:MAG: DUF3098 domain-containing protein [Cytophagales bacterium]|nr:DUF3098 domain-containing protein [Bernardetiaceae bacterium]MDW8204715.1 DUF3098 domain-containing protein [Cytophagales bacterium]
MRQQQGFAFGKQNYLLMLTGLGFIILGFLLMALDQEPFGFGVLGLTVGPITVLSGFAIEFFAIMMKSKSK